jgi:hypothetical protein
MKKLWNGITTLSVITVIYSPNLAFSQEKNPIILSDKETQSLIELFKSCDQVASTCSKTNSEKDAIIAAQQQALNTQNTQLKELQASSHSIIDNKVIWFGLGMLVTGFTVHLVKP